MMRKQLTPSGTIKITTNMFSGPAGKCAWVKYEVSILVSGFLHYTRHVIRHGTLAFGWSKVVSVEAQHGIDGTTFPCDGNT